MKTQDYSKDIIGTYDMKTIAFPEMSDWRVHLVGNFVYQPLKDQVPNWFHRLMHRLIFGFKWEKIKK